MKYLLGSKEEFWKFVESISEGDKVGIITHTDLDGIASAIFLEMILNSKDIKINSLHFIRYKLGMFNSVLPELEKNNITKVFLTDMYADGTDAEGFEKLKEKFDVFVIDHHPLVDKNAKNVIKTQSSDCSAFAIYDLGEEIIDKEKWKWLVYATMISEMSHKNPVNMGVIRKDYPDTNEVNILNSPLGEIAKNISSALIYFGSNIKKIYDLIKKNDLKEFEKARKIIDSEIENWEKDFKRNAEYYPEKEIYIYYFEPKYDISSIFSTILSMKELDKSFVIIALGKTGLKLSARNQSKKQDMAALLKKGIQGLKDAVAGGHIPAAGGSCLREDLAKFKENLLK
ncbi:MAG TPA: DHH family phosphoesterase [Candidatus Nanoarchaeia archaeon]|nr:DHH family phosphoesterase [Candidatus Nanoarchaeia archaeon]